MAVPMVGVGKSAKKIKKKRDWRQRNQEDISKLRQGPRGYGAAFPKTWDSKRKD